MDNEQRLHSILRKLNPSGLEGFEGLISKLLQSLTGRRFFLAKAGYQGGRDLSSEKECSNIIAVECKRYQKNTDFRQRDLLGELQEVQHDIPELDLWVLVATRGIDERLYQLLCRSAEDKGIEILMIETEDTIPSSLSALCANSIDIVSDHIKRNLPDEDIQLLREAIAEIANHGKYTSVKEKIFNKLYISTIGYESWKIKRKEILLKQFSSERDSRAAFHQILNIAEIGINLIERKNVWEQISGWYTSWKEHYKLLVVQGEEGDGKTWAVSSWITKHMKEDSDFPPIIFLSSQNVSSDEITELFVNAFNKDSTYRKNAFWVKRLRNWLERPLASRPYILLILDGINERPGFDWRKLLAVLDVEPWRGRVAVIITCRSTYWNKSFKNLEYMDVQSLVIPPYNDEELTLALSLNGLGFSSINENILSLVRKPRYFDLMMKHRNAIETSGDITVERLIYEDIKDRIKRKNILDGFGYDELTSFIKHLSEKASSVLDNFTEADINNSISPFIVDKRAVFIELTTGGILIEDPLKTGQYKVDERRLVYGFGLLIAEHVHQLADLEEQKIEEAISSLIEPYSDMDLKVKICGAAVFHSLIIKNFPEIGKIVLFKTWFNGRNLDMTSYDSFPAYFPTCPEIYMNLAEYYWAGEHENYMAQELLMSTLLEWRDHDKFFDMYKEIFERWMGYIHPYGFSSNRNRNDMEKSKKKIEGRIGSTISFGPINFAGLDFIVIEDEGMLRLARVALAVISHLPRKPFLGSFTKWAVSRSIMGYPNEYELLKWVFRTSSDYFWEELEQVVQSLIKQGRKVLKQAAHRLLSAEGSLESYKLLEILPSDLFPQHPFKEKYKDDPCTQKWFLWGKDVYKDCLNRKDIAPATIAREMRELSLEPHLSVPSNLTERLSNISQDIDSDLIWTNMGMTVEDHFLEKIEPAMCAFAPNEFAEIVKRIIRTVSSREGLPLRQLSFALEENSLIFSEEEYDAIRNAWAKLYSAQNKFSKDEEFIASRLFSFIIEKLSAEKQIEKLLSRSENAWDSRDYELLFKPFSSYSSLENIISELQTTKEDKKICRVLWFLTVNAEALPLNIVELICQFLKSSDSLIRYCVLEITYKSKHQSIINEFVNSDWQWNTDNCEYENYWGSMLLCDYGSKISYNEVRSRIYPIYLGRAVKQRGFVDEEIIQYAEDINKVWTYILKRETSLLDDLPPIDVSINLFDEMSDVEVNTISLSSSIYSNKTYYVAKNAFWGGLGGGSKNDDFKQAFEGVSTEKIERLYKKIKDIVKEQLKAGNIWFSQHFPEYALKEIVLKRLDLVDQWIEAIKYDSMESNRCAMLCQSFYEALCKVLLEEDYPRGIALYNALQNRTGRTRFVDSRLDIKTIDHSVFCSKENDEINELLISFIENCANDKEIFDVALLAQVGEKVAWLNKLNLKYWESSRPFNKARALVFLSLLHDAESYHNLVKITEEMPESWLKEIGQNAIKKREKNEWAKTWFARFVESEDDVISWASFKLFLKCVDRRFWIWGTSFISNLKNSNSKNRLLFYRFNIDKIKRNIEKNEKELKDTFLFHKILKNQAWPWMSNY